MIIAIKVYLNVWNEALQHYTPHNWGNCVNCLNKQFLKKNWYDRGKKVMEMDIDPVIIVNFNESSSSEKKTCKM